MAVVRDFQSYRKKREGHIEEEAAGQTAAQAQEEAPEEELSPEALKKRKRGIVFGVVGTVIIAALIAAGAYMSYRDRVFTEAIETDSVNVLMSQDVSARALDGVVLQYSGDGAGCIDANGTSLWNQTYQMQSPIVKTDRDTAAIADFNGRTIYVANKSGTLGEIRTSLPVRTFAVSSKGVVAAVLDDSDVTRINLYDTEGTELATFKTTMSDSGYPLSVAVSPNGQMVCVSYLSANNAQAETDIAFYNFGSVGQNKVDHLTGGYSFPGAVAPVVRFFDDGTAYAICTDRIVFFTGDQVPKQQAQTLFGNGEVLTVYEGDNAVGLLFGSDSGDSAYRLDVYDNKGVRVLQKPLDRQYASAMFAERQIVLYDSEEWKVIDRDGTDRYEGQFDQRVKLVLPTRSSARYLLVTADAFRTVELR